MRITRAPLTSPSSTIRLAADYSTARYTVSSDSTGRRGLAQSDAFSFASVLPTSIDSPRIVVEKSRAKDSGGSALEWLSKHPDVIAKKAGAWLVVSPSGIYGEYPEFTTALAATRIPGPKKIVFKVPDKTANVKYVSARWA